MYDPRMELLWVAAAISFLFVIFSAIRYEMKKDECQCKHPGMMTMHHDHELCQPWRERL